MSASTLRKEATTERPEGSWVTLHRASRILGESRDLVAKRCLRGEIATWTPAHLLLLFEEDVLKVAAAKRAAAASAETAG